MAKNFITNNENQKSLKGRIRTLISISDELKFLVGFFYFSGWEEVYQQLRENKNIQLKLLVGLQVSKLVNQMVEHGEEEEDLSQEDHFHKFMSSLGQALNNEEMDTEPFYNQVTFFLRMIQENRLLIRKTENPNHAKLYLFKLNQEQSNIQNMTGQFVTGSSNLTKAGLSGQEEFNVEIKDYGFPEAESYFDELWERAIPISEDDTRRKKLLRFIEYKSQAATVTPFEAYALVLKTYLDLQEQKHIRPEVEGLLEEKGFKKYSYQLDAVNQALNIIETYNGVIIADVVGLGKSIIASLIAKNLGQRGMVICPPGLMGDKMSGTGWYGYIQDFRLYDWEVESRGRLQELAEYIHEKNIDVVIVDEAHYYRNQDTADYEALLNICRDKTVILLTATPFSNSPADIFSLLKLFLVPGKSGITIEDNLEGLFSAYNFRFRQLNEIMKYYNSDDPKKSKKAEQLYVELIGDDLPVDIDKVRRETQRLANKLKNIISSVVIRRNRLDLKKDRQYSQEVDQLSDVQDPVELFFELSPEQNDFYNRIIHEYFRENGRFSGAIYQPFSYETIVEDPENLDETGNRAYQQQRNLYDFMRRLLVKRFESSFGAFAESIERFLRVHEIVEDFIEQSNGKYILDRKLIEDIYQKDEDEIMESLYKFENDLLEKKVPKNNRVYDINEFERKEDFLADIQKDKELFKAIMQELEQLNIVEQDPKREAVYDQIDHILKNESPRRKVVVFSEYIDTIRHLEGFLSKRLGERLLVCEGKVTKQLQNQLYSDFDAQYKGEQTDQFDVLITSDKLSEGISLNRAGAIINYDIPWNPTRVIQRVGRINRIGTKVFDELYIYNFFPTETGADVVKSREIAGQKMFLIHNSLGEDAKIFEAGEEPTPSGLFNRLNQNPYDAEELNTSTIIRNQYSEIKEQYPEVISKIKELPHRVKTAKSYSHNQLTVLRKKGLGLFSQVVNEPQEKDNQVEEVPFEEFLPLVECEYDQTRLELSKNFWPAYNAIKSYKPKYKASKSENALETKAHTNLKLGLKLLDPKEEAIAEFMKTLIRDIRQFHTLSSRTLGRLGRKNLSEKSDDQEQKAFFDEVRWIMNQLGSDYLEKILKRVEGQKSEVIIGVENQSK